MQFIEHMFSPDKNFITDIWLNESKGTYHSVVTDLHPGNMYVTVEGIREAINNFYKEATA